MYVFLMCFFLLTFFTSYLTVDGNWTLWTRWGSCDQSCGLGRSSRVRWCTNPEPFAGGKYCEGEPVESAQCNDFPCPGT